MMLEGYPAYAILLVLGVGFPLAFLRPYTAFLGAVLLLTAGHVSMLNETRAEDVVPFLNLMHATFVVALLACFVDRVAGKKPIWIPPIVGLMVFVLTFATVQTVWVSGWQLQTMRYWRGALDFPVVFLLGANMVTSEDRARKLIGVLLAGTLLASLQHIFAAANIWQARALTMKNYEVMRNIGWWAGCMPSAFLIAATVWKGPSRLGPKILYATVGLAFLASLFLNQTRSLWISTAVATVLVVMLFKRRAWVKSLAASLAGVLLLSFAFGGICRYAFPGLDIPAVLAKRADDLLYNKRHTGSRIRSFNAELGQWYDGTLICGRGLAFFGAMEDSGDSSKHIAFNHLGYVTYLSQLGIVGLFAYGFCLPLGVLRNGRRLWRFGKSSTLRYLALLGTASIVCVSILFSMSGHFLLRGYEPAGVLYGAMWVLTKRSPSMACRTFRQE